jgi:hypothetical protein
MGSAPRVLLACLLALASLLMVQPSDARRPRARVEWTKIEVPRQNDDSRLESKFRKYLEDAAKRADFGKLRHVEASVKVVELKWEDQTDLVRLTCVVVGRLKGGPSARSRISFGGHPDRRDQLEKQVLSSVARGVVGRIAQLARVAAENAEPKSP